MQIQIDPIWQAATQQQVFRRLLEAMSLPGTVATLPPTGRSRAALALLAALLDHSVTFCDRDGFLPEAARHMLEARRAAPEAADYLLARADLPPADGFAPRLGTLDGPDASTTIVLAGQRLGQGDVLIELVGPGVQTTRRLALAGFDAQWFSRRTDWCAQFPLGVDMLLVDETGVAALPRSSTVRVTRRSSWAM